MPTHPHFHLSQSVLFCLGDSVAQRALRRKRSRFSGALEAQNAGTRPCKRVALAISNGHKCIVEGGIDKNNPFGHILLILAAHLDGEPGRLGHIEPLIQLTMGTCARSFLVQRRTTTGTFAGTGIGLGSLPPNRQATTMTAATVTTQVHQALDVH